jgi:hypothetical protein
MQSVRHRTVAARFAPVHPAQPLVSPGVPRRPIYLDGRRLDYQQHAAHVWRRRDQLPAVFFVLFLSRVVLRREWVAVVATIAIVAGIDYAPGGMRLADLPFEIALLGILTVVMLRFGLIAAIFGYTIKSILRALPHTLHFSAWYAGTTAVPLILLALLALYGFRTSLGGRRLIQLPD